jgi:peptide/nickel transport system ATP-binding protein
MQAILEVKNLTKIYSLGSVISPMRITAVDNVSFTIQPAEIYTLAGESGCGKTTIARIILGFEYPTSGEILYRGERIGKLKDRKSWFKEIQAVFQNPFETFNPLRKVENYFFETIRNYKLVKDSKKAEDLIDQKLRAVGLSFREISGKYPGELSGGQLQRASVARSLLTDPSLLITDEPVSMVDASLRMSIVNLLRKLRDEFNVTVIYITHDLATAYYISNRIAIMFRGNIVEMGPVEKVLMDPKHPYTRLLRESIPQPDPRKKWNTGVKLSEREHEEYLRRGCKFAGRCPEVLEVCKREVPEVPKDICINNVLVKCHKYKMT